MVNGTLTPSDMNLGVQTMFYSVAHVARLSHDDLTLLRASARTLPMMVGGMVVWSFCLLLML